MNKAFKHLEAKLRFGDLTIGQWATVIGGLLLGLLFAQYLSPIDGLPGVVLGVYLAAIPASAAFFASLSEFDLMGVAVAALRRHRHPARFLPGGGTNAHGYLLLVKTKTADEGSPETPDFEIAALWG